MDNIIKKDEWASYKNLEHSDIYNRQLTIIDRAFIIFCLIVNLSHLLPLNKALNAFILNRGDIRSNLLEVGLLSIPQLGLEQKVHFPFIWLGLGDLFHQCHVVHRGQIQHLHHRQHLKIYMQNHRPDSRCVHRRLVELLNYKNRV